MKSSCWFFLFALALAIGACEDDPPPKNEKDEAEEDAGAEQGLVDPELQKALRETPTAAPTATAGPPPGGIFAPGRADEAHPADAPPDIEVIERGGEPRVKLRPPMELGESQTIRLLVVEAQSERQGAPIVYTLRLSHPDDGEGDDGEEAPAPAPDGAKPLVMTIEGLGLQNGEVPEKLKKVFEQAMGSSITTKILPSGALQGAEVRYGDDLKDEGVRPLVDKAAEALGLFFAPYPDEPVGEGGYWIASDRSTMNGLELVRYRVTKVEELRGDEATLSIDLRQYLADGDVKALLAGGNAGDVAAAGFDSAGKGELSRKTGALVPATAQLRTSFNLQIASKQNPQQVAQVPMQFQAQILPPPKDAKKKED